MSDVPEREARTGRTETVVWAGFAGVAFPLGLAVFFLALHLPYLPQSLEDLDSINFALGVRRFDVAHHQPHPPGYPVFILIAKAVHTMVPSEATALALVSVGAGALGVVAIGWLFRQLDGSGTPSRWPLIATAVAMTTPLYWFTAVRPLSDSSGLAAALAVQAMTLAANSTRALAAAAFCAGLATGIRSQVAWLTLPLLIFAGLRAQGSRRESDSTFAVPSPERFAPMATAFVAGTALWLVPLVSLSGGPTAYWRALFDQGAEDLGNIQMLWTAHGLRDLREALYYALIAPWAAWPLAAIVLVCGGLGAIRLARTQPRALTILAFAFVPYLVFDLLFQETFTSRYALPLVVPLAYLAVAGLRALPWDSGLAAAIAVAMFSAHVGGTSIAAYSRAAAPAFRMLEAMRSQTPSAGALPVLAPDRREAFDLRGPRKWLGEAFPRVSQTLAAPPQHEWLEAAKYWNGHGRAPVWFVVDPLRASIDLVQHGEPVRFRWDVPYPVLLSGVRPNEMDWYRVDRPEWYVGEGWALTPESAGVAAADRQGPSIAPISGWVHGSASSGGTVMIGGRSFDPTLRPLLTVTLARRVLITTTLMPGAFLQFVPLPFSQRDDLAPAYDALTVTATTGSRVAVEQFDVSARRPLLGFGDGWHEQELNPQTGRRWRWLSDRGELRVVGEPMGIASHMVRLHPTAGSLTLHLEGESPRPYFSRGSRLVIRSGERVLFDETLSTDFSRDVPVPAAADTLILETDQTYVPAERSSRTQDRRRLGLRIFKAELRRTNPPAS